MVDTILGSDLDRVADIVENGWTQKAYARNKSGREVAINASDAVDFCTSGAMYRLVFVEKRAKNDTSAICSAITDQFMIDYPVESKKYTYTYVCWQDEPNRTKEEVVTLIRNAAARVSS